MCQRIRVQVALGQQPLAVAGQVLDALGPGRQLGLQGFVLLEQALHGRHAVAALANHYQLLLLTV